MEQQGGFSKGEAIRFGWEVAKKHILFFIVIFVIYYAVFFALGIAQGATKENAPVIALLVGIISWVVSTVMQMGLYKVPLMLVDGKQPSYSDLFSSYRLFFPYLLATIIYSLLVFAGFILLIIPGIYFSIKFSLYGYFIIDKGAGPIAALKMSSAATNGVKINLLLFWLLEFLIVLAGLLALVVGLIVAAPTVMVASAYVYRKLSKQV